MLRLHPPGSRKGNRYWLIRGRHRGRIVEISTRSTDETVARARLDEAIKALDADAAPLERSFATAAAAYLRFRRLPREQEVFVERLVSALGPLALADVTHAEIVAAAQKLYPGLKPASHNRLVITPAGAILHYAAEQGWCRWLRLKPFKVPRPRTRAVAQVDAAKLMAAATGEARALLEVLFGTGLRIGDVLALRWDQIDLRRRLIRLRIAKTGVDRELPLSSLALKGLRRLRSAGRERVWTVQTRWDAYRLLDPAQARSGVVFTPHMARHSVGTWLNQAGEGLKTIMAALGHADPKSSLRYQDADVDTVRRAWAALPKGRR